MLIPNIHLETPNYSINRIKNEDANEEMIRASYQMVEMPSDVEQAPVAQESRPVRAEAAVKGITPTSPAPVAVEKAAPAAAPEASKGLIGRIKGWFGKIGGAKPVKEEIAPPAIVRSEPNRSATNRTRGNRSGRGERAVNAERSAESATGARNTGETGGNERSSRNQPGRQNQQSRNEKPERSPVERGQVEREKPAQNGQTSNQQVEGVTEPRGRRGRNNRRERGPRPENNQVAEFTPESNGVPVAAAAIAVGTESFPMENNVFNEPLAAPAESQTVEFSPGLPPVSATPEIEPVEQPLEVAVQEIAQVHEAEMIPTFEMPQAVEPVTVNVAEEISVDANESQISQPLIREPAEFVADFAVSGLQLVETSRDALQTAVVEEPKPNLPHKPAAWQQMSIEQSMNDEPLVMVETQK